MASARPKRRMTLLELLVHVEKCTHDLRERMRGSVWPILADCHDISRPHRKHSHYPTMLALRHALENLDAISADLQKQFDGFLESLQEIDEHVQREQRRSAW